MSFLKSYLTQGHSLNSKIGWYTNYNSQELIKATGSKFQNLVIAPNLLNAEHAEYKLYIHNNISISNLGSYLIYDIIHDLI